VLSVRLSHHGAAIAAILVTLCGQLASAQGPGQGVPGQGAAGGARPAAAPAAAGAELSGTRVAVIDIALIFKHHDRFNGSMGDIKRDIEQFEAYVKGQQASLKTRAEELQQFGPTSAEYKAKEAELARTQSQLQVEIGLKRKEFLEKEARVYYQVYKEIENAVAMFSQRASIGLVLRYNSDDMKEDDRQSVLQGVNKAVVYHQGLDITEYIITNLNRRPFNPNDKPGGAAPTIPAAGGPAGTISRPPAIPNAKGLNR
jgi:Skp family chaperone for outer membrane proteins